MNNLSARLAKLEAQQHQAETREQQRERERRAHQVMLLDAMFAKTVTDALFILDEAENGTEPPAPDSPEYLHARACIDDLLARLAAERHDTPH